jgi:hypothetical protein
MQERLQNQVYDDAVKKSLAAEKDLLADPHQQNVEQL